ncbi:hypothetical protein HFP15_18875 [Amycolatopsis sp. K13G38]|uniref:Uncharacterized protein n=1 Tax=Amycolatopsis acididurans TaxID=2724524 RepID=A0ABX1J592_9PSEU|nr:hypothetical protein [Amycolatopsis acididurans]NKQ54951.1 hypothetical protein [Amycolatopsis acididurans]
MTNTEQEPTDLDTAAEQLAKEAATGVAPTGNWEPNTPPPVAAPTGNWEPNTPPPVAAPTGNWEPNTPPPVAAPTGNWEPNTPPPVAAPTGNWEPNTPPPNGAAPAPTPAPAAPAAQGAWVYGRQITQLFASSTHPGVWAFVGGVGWRRLASSEVGRSPLTTLALLAKTNGLAVSYHEDAYGQIDELQV